jgi:hypothetical protein
MKPADWPDAFATGWRQPKPVGFIDFFMPLIDEHAVFTQPLAPTAKGHAQVQAMFERLFARFPDFMVTPHASHIYGDTIAIQSTCTVTIGRQRLAFPVEDRLTLSDGRIARREATFSTQPLVVAILRSPKIWKRLLDTK